MESKPIFGKPIVLLEMQTLNLIFHKASYVSCALLLEKLPFIGVDNCRLVFSVLPVFTM